MPHGSKCMYGALALTWPCIVPLSLAVVASFYPPVYYGFMCSPGLKLFYLASTTALGLSTLSVTLLQRFQDPSWHAARALLFVTLGVWGVVPLMHSAWLNGGVPEVSSAVQLDLLMGAVYLVSVLFLYDREVAAFVLCGELLISVNQLLLWCAGACAACHAQRASLHRTVVLRAACECSLPRFSIHRSSAAVGRRDLRLQGPGALEARRL